MLLTWCAEQGIEVQFTVPYSPPQNSVAEHLNRMIAELVRAMLIARGIPRFLWPEAVVHTAYLRNQAHTRALLRSTPEEKWSGSRPNVAHLQEFGTAVWILKEGSNISKLDAKSEKHTFMGFLDSPKAMKYFDTHTRQVKVSCNYHFPVTELSVTAPETSQTTPAIQCEGESVPEITVSKINDAPQSGGSGPSGKNKRKCVDEIEDLPLRHSTWPRIQHNYSQPDDSLSNLEDDPEENSPISSTELVYVAFTKSNFGKDDLRSLQEAKNHLNGLNGKKPSNLN
jgi:hypothetical protein